MDGQAAQLRHIILMLSKGGTALIRNNSPWIDRPHNLDQSMDGQAAQLRHIILMLSKGGTCSYSKQQSMDEQAAQLRPVHGRTSRTT